MYVKALYPACIPNYVMQGEVVQMSEERFIALSKEFPCVFERVDPFAQPSKPELPKAEPEARPESRHRMGRANLVS